MKKYILILSVLSAFILGQFLLFTDITYSQTLPDYTADRVIGQTDFVTGSCGTTQTKLSNPISIALDTIASPPILYVADNANHRVLGFYNYPFLQNGAPADFVIGQSDFSSAVSSTTDSTFSWPIGVAVDSKRNLWVAEHGNNRVIVFISPTTTDFKADYVLGQGGSFESAVANLGGVSDSSLNGPLDIVFDNQNRTYICDMNNHRILVFDDPLNNDLKADWVIGQPDFSSNGASVSDSTFNLPYGCFITDSGDLFVADHSNNRVLKFIDPLNDKKADQVFGQSGIFTTSTVNQPGLNAEALYAPVAVYVDKQETLFISDEENNRVLAFTAPLDTTADYVYGQVGSFTDTTAGTSADSLNIPRDILIDNKGNLLLTELGNCRILKFFKTNDADIFVGVPAGGVQFGGVVLGESKTDSFWVRNAGLSDLTVSDITVPDGFTLLTATSFTLSYGDSQLVEIKFFPTEKTTYSGNIIITSDDPDEPTVNISVSGSGIYGSTWTTQTSGSGQVLKCVHFIDSHIGWAVGNAGTILHTTDGGANWSSQTSGTAVLLNGFCLTNSNTCWVAGNSGTILHTTDGGANWGSQTSGTSEDILSIYLTDSNTGWATGYSGTILHTTNGGANWSSQTSGTTQLLQCVHFIDSDTGWAAGTSGTILHTTDGGTNWSSQTSGTALHISSIYFINSDTGWAVGYTGTILNTTDGGTNWSSQTSGTSEHIRGLYFLDSNTGWAVGDNGTILYTTNGGTNWGSQTSSTTEILEGVYFVNSNTGWAVGYSGTILKYTVPDMTVSIPDTTAAPGDTIDLPVMLSNVEPPDSILSFDFKVIYESAELKIIDYDVAGLLADGFTIDTTTSSTGDTFMVAGAHTTPFASNGALMKIKCIIDSSFGPVGDSIFINFTDIFINEWEFSANAEKGIIYYPSYYGDVSLDQQIITTDASLILKHRVYLITLSDTALAAADVSGIGGVTGYDAALILQYVASMISVFPVGEEMYTLPKEIFKNSIAKLIKDSEDDEYVYYSLQLSNIKDVYSSTIALELSGLECEYVRKTEVLNNYLMEHNVHNDMLYIALAGNESLNNDEKIIKLKFKKSIKDGILSLNSVLVNEVEINIEEESATVPKVYGLNQNYPNPFNPETTIKYQLPEKCRVEIYIYNILGQRIKTLVDKDINAGYHSVKWDGTNDFGKKVSSGIYIYRIKTNTGFVNVKKMVFLK